MLVSIGIDKALAPLFKTLLEEDYKNKVRTLRLAETKYSRQLKRQK